MKKTTLVYLNQLAHVISTKLEEEGATHTLPEDEVTPTLGVKASCEENKSAVLANFQTLGTAAARHGLDDTHISIARTGFSVTPSQQWNPDGETETEHAISASQVETSRDGQQMVEPENGQLTFDDISAD